MIAVFSDYVVYVDESGDHGLARIDQDYPVFVLIFCVFHKQAYANSLVPALQQLKFKYFGHDQVVLHERDIRKRQGDFSFLKDVDLRRAFIRDISSLVEHAPVNLIISLIDKRKLKARYRQPFNPYVLSMRFGLERLAQFLALRRQVSLTHVVVERRGKMEDAQLQEAFDRICQGDNWHRESLPFRLVFADKKSNSAGLQLADLIARPAGMSYLRPQQANRAWEVVKSKVCTGPDGRVEGFGMKVFP